MADITAKNNLNISGCYGKNCLVEAAKAMNVEKVLTGSVERFGEKIIIVLRIIDVKNSIIEKIDITEYQNVPTEIQHMVEISVKKVLGMENDVQLKSL